jgi:hypothetical protein
MFEPESVEKFPSSKANPRPVMLPDLMNLPLENATDVAGVVGSAAAFVGSTATFVGLTGVVVCDEVPQAVNTITSRTNGNRYLFLLFKIFLLLKTE